MERSQVPKYVMSTLCRICAEKSSKLTPIFEIESLAIKIYKCLLIQVNKLDYLPLKVCESCLFKINESYMFCIKADEADQRLKKLWKILIKETMSDNANVEDKAVAVITDCQSFVNLQEKKSPSNLVINIPQELTYHSVEILRGDNVQLNSEFPSEVMVISKAISFEVVSESLVLQSSEKSNNHPQRDENLSEESKEAEKKATDQEESKQTAKPFHCQFCPYQFTSVANLNVHESTHSEGKPFLCDTCGKSFKHAKYLRSHSRIHSTVRKKHTCNICNKGFLTNFFLQEHMNAHTGETPYKCPVCEKEFREKVHLRQHKWTHSNQKFACPICGSKFNRKGNMVEHKKHHHKNGTEVKSKTRKTLENDPLKKNTNFKCSICNCEFSDQVLLKNHLKIHPEQKRFSCPICRKKFRHAGSLTYHRRAAHTGERPFQCSYCDLRFSLRSVQANHERKNHTFEQPYRCKFCSRSFTSSSSLRNHTYVHAEDKMFKCDECGKKFTRNSNLFVHKKIHSGERKFTCNQCGKSYIQKHDLLKHAKAHDPKSKPFFCKYCGNSFSHKKDARKHSMCQFEYLRKSNCEFYSAEKMLDSVANNLEKAGREFSVEEEQQIILESVEELSGARVGDMYRDPNGLNPGV